jgi:hypothetical protein
MPISTYSELQSEIAAWLHRANLTDRIPVFIQLAEERIKKLLRVREMLSEQSLAVTADNAEVALPARFIQMRSLRISGSNADEVLTYQPMAALQNIDPNAGTPKYHSYNDDALFLSPTPSSDQTLIADCFVMPAALSAEAPTNSLLTAYPSIYLQGGLREGFLYTRNREQAAQAEQLFMQAVNEANKASRKLLSSGVSSPQMAFKGRIP